MANKKIAKKKTRSKKVPKVKVLSKDYISQEMVYYQNDLDKLDLTSSISVIEQLRKISRDDVKFASIHMEIDALNAERKEVDKEIEKLSKKKMDKEDKLAELACYMERGKNIDRKKDSIKLRLNSIAAEVESSFKKSIEISTILRLPQVVHEVDRNIE
jgi:seryl-tRNA synthetase